MKFIRSRETEYVLLALIFLGMLLLNTLTPLLTDDYTYCFSFADGTRLSSLRQIPASMRAHSLFVNGRYFAHFLVQISVLLPKGIFNVFNAAVFTLIIFLLYRLCRTEENNLLLLSIFFSVWVFTPAFGQVYLWLDGSCNYSWASLWALLYLLPYIRFFREGKRGAAILWIAMTVFGFFVGGYLENTSAAAVYLALLLLALGRFYKKERCGILALLPILSACGGYLFMVTRPAQQVKLISGSLIVNFAKGFIVTMKAYVLFKYLLFAYVIGFVLACFAGAEKDRLIFSAALFSGSLGAAFLLSFASYVPGRCLAFPALLLTAAAAIVWAELFAVEKYRAAVCAASAVLALTGVYWLAYGGADVLNTYMVDKENMRTVQSGLTAGERDFRLPLIETYTQYSPIVGLKYLDTNDPNSWPNYDMARYIGVDSLLGYDPKPEG